MSGWVRAPDYIRSFNGLVQSRVQGNTEYGVFKERDGRRWAVRTRPLGDDGGPLSSWSAPVRSADTKRDVLASLDAML